MDQTPCVTPPREIVPTQCSANHTSTHMALRDEEVREKQRKVL